MDKFYVYLLSNKHHTVFYTGFTDDLERRVYEHKNKLLKSFTNKYNIDTCCTMRSLRQQTMLSTAKNN